MNIKEDLHFLAIRRKKLNKQKLAEKDLKERLESSPEYLALNALQRDMGYTKDDIGRVELQIKNNVTHEFIQTGLEITKPYDGIQIKKFQVVHVLDEKEAIAWAGVNAPQVLSLRKAPFNKIAKVLDLSFVEINTEYRAQIASELSMYEENENER